MKDRNCGIELVLITESTVLLIKNLSLNIKDKSKRIVVVISFATVVWFSNLESAEAIGFSMPPTPVVRVQPNYKDTYEIKVAPTIYRLHSILSYTKYTICCHTFYLY